MQQISSNSRGYNKSSNKKKYNIAQNETFVQMEIGSKIEPYEYSPISEILLFL